MIKQKRKEKAGKWQVPIPKVKTLSEDEMFKVMRTGKRKSKQQFIFCFTRLNVCISYYLIRKGMETCC
jgi:hypothetical protein